MSQDFATPNPALAAGTTHAGFTVERAEPLPELSGCAYVLRHNATGARVMWLACADNNKAFAISFKTPPTNDTGVFHILEHSVLCGSDRFPVKEPFVHLLKSSMQTFLNALTFPDKTMYPVASTNDRDLENLMDIYLDAVLHPAIYRRRRIFEQEGWHYEVAASQPDAPLTLNGVVYNEMKGALSTPEEILINGMMRSLFGQTPYGFVSGGDPEAIPTLTYEEFLRTHERHYQLANSYTILYGDLDIEEKLAFLGTRFDAARPSTAGAPNELPYCSPRTCELLSVPMQTTPDNACAGVAYVFAKAGERERVLAADILVDALVGSNEAPLKRAVLESGLGSDVLGYLYDGILQPCLIFELKGAKPGVAKQFEKLVEDTCARLVEQGLGQDNLEASIAQAEFNLREGDFGYPDGVGLAIQAMSGWLYSDDDATSYLRYEDALAHIREEVAAGEFEHLLDEAVCHNDHRCCVEVVPTATSEESAETRRLAEKRATLTDEELAAIAAEAEALHAEQAAPDTPEALATLPHLSLSDIGEGPQDPKTRKVEALVPCYHHLIDAHRIGYAYWYFNLGGVSFEELPYVSVLANLLGKLDTEKHSAYDLDTICEAKLGGLSFFTEVYSTDDDPESARPKFVVGASALSENARWLAELPAEVWGSTRLADTQRIRDILEQRRVGMEQAFVEGGHAAALSRVSSQFLASSVVSEQLGGVDFYRFLCDLLANFDARADALVAKLEDLRRRIFSRGNCEMSFTGDEADLDAFWDAAADLGLSDAAQGAGELVVPKPHARAEAFVVPSNVCYVGEGMAGVPAGTSLNGAWRVASQALSYDYLWNEVRVLGGAYGCGFRCTADSLLQFYSYRDPAVDSTVERFERAAEWIAAWDPTPAELDGFIVAGVSGMDAPVKPRSLGRRLDAARLSGRTPEWRQRIRREMLETTVGDVRALAKPLDKLGQSRGMCVFGGREQIEASGLDLDVCELIASQK
ncbi:insulinase family protein [uncultured Parolsenella sp.]|uniref:insulinase family protein n=1 Tax=uncultured Parolsenella sp. TaxID=2083008 RepID=UPI0027DDF3D7|nr:insulinase family protein [uncultured Parolsenella sp.]